MMEDPQEPKFVLSSQAHGSTRTAASIICPPLLSQRRGTLQTRQAFLIPLRSVLLLLLLLQGNAAKGSCLSVTSSAFFCSLSLREASRRDTEKRAGRGTVQDRAFTTSNMLKCFSDCAYLDLMEDRTAADTANRTYSYSPHSMATGVMRQQKPTGTGESANRREKGGGREGNEEEEKEDDYDGDSPYDEDSDSEYEKYYTDDDQIDESSMHAPGPGERTWEYRKDEAAHQDITPGISKGMNRKSVSYVPQSSRRSGESIMRKNKTSYCSSDNAATAASYGAPVSTVHPVSLPAPFAEAQASAKAAAANSSAKAAMMAVRSAPNPRNLAHEATSRPPISSSPAAGTKVRCSQNPGKRPKMCKARTTLARRTESNLVREATEKTSGAPSGRRSVSTCVEHVRQSQDRTTLYIIKSKGGMHYKLAYDDIVEVDEIPSEEKVVLIAKDIEVHIVFKGRAASLKKFCTTLKSTRNASLPSKGNAVSSGNPSTSSK